jgi:hypothetical protein
LSGACATLAADQEARHQALQLAGWQPRSDTVPLEEDPPFVDRRAEERNTGVTMTASPGSCALSAPGHLPHFIQAKLALGNHRPTILQVAAIDDGGITVTDGHAHRRWLVHPQGRDVIAASSETTVRDHGHFLALIGDRCFSYLPIEDADQWLPCALEDVNTGGPIGHFTVDDRVLLLRDGIER